MTKYIALLRGINVGGHNQIKMAALREALQTLALQNIQTYIQSGNILLTQVNLRLRCNSKFKLFFRRHLLLQARSS